MPNSSASTGRRAFLGALGGGGLAATAGCLEAEWADAGASGGDAGPLDVVVHFEGAALPDDLEGADVPAALREHAERSHAPLRRFATRTRGIELRREFWLADAVLATVDPNVVALDGLRRVDGVTTVYPNCTCETVERGVEPNGQSTGPESTESATSASPPAGSDANQQLDAEVTDALDRLHAAPVWELYGARGEGVDVAVLDSGVDPAGHDGIATALDRGGWAEFDDAGERVESEPHDPDGHGTGVSGLVVGGETDEGVRYGVAPEAALYHAKVTGEDGLYAAQLIAGLEWAVEQGVDVVSVSLGPPSYPLPFVEPVANARQAGVLVVGSVGDAGHYTSASPGNLPTTLGVGAVDGDGTVAEFSGGERIRTERYWGPDAPDPWPEEYTVPDVTAVGVDVTTATAGGGYDPSGGASAATPLVAGAAALARSAADDPSVDDLERAIVAGTLHPATDDAFDVDPGRDDRYGAGVASATFATTSLVADQEVRGVVRDEDGRPLPHADVVSEVGAWTTADEAGRFEIELPSMEVPVGAFAVGHEPRVELVDPVETDEIELTAQRSDGADVALTRRTPVRIDPGGEATAAFTVANVEAVTVDVRTDVLLEPGDLELRVDGTSAAFGERVDVDASERTANFEIAIASTDGARVGRFTAHVAFHGSDGTVSGELHEVYHHPDPIRIGAGDLPSLQGPVDLVAPGTTIELGDGRFDEPVDAEAGALVLDKPISLVAADGAAPTLAVEGADPETPGVFVAANDVRVSGMEVAAEGASTAIQIGSAPRGRDTVAPSAATIADVTIHGADTGIDVRTAPAAHVDGNDVTAAETGISIRGGESTLVASNEVHGVSTGVLVAGLVTAIEENRIHDVDGSAIRLELPREDLRRIGVEQGPVRRNVVERAAVGIEVADGAAAGPIEDNEFRDVTTQQSGVDGTGPADEDSVLGLVLYGATGLSLVALLVPYARRRLKRRLKG